LEKGDLKREAGVKRKVELAKRKVQQDHCGGLDCKMELMMMRAFAMHVSPKGRKPWQIKKRAGKEENRLERGKEPGASAAAIKRQKIVGETCIL